MRVSRRAFIITGLLSVPGLLYWKKNIIITNDIKSFFSYYENVIPIQDALNTGSQISLFEEKIILMLSRLGATNTKTVVDQIIKDEYGSGKVRLMNGWIVTETELNVLMLRKKYV